MIAVNEDKKVVFSFDRDGTIDVNPLNIDQRAIPLRWIQYLAHQTDHEVWAHGNQKLKKEAGIPGTAELFDEYKERYGDPIRHVNERPHKDLETKLSTEVSAPNPDPDITTAAANWYKRGISPHKQQHLRLLAILTPNADKYVCVDNQYLGYVSNWTFYYPNEFVEIYHDTLGDRLEEFDNMTRLKNQVDSAGCSFENDNTNTRMKLISSVGRRLPRTVREQFEIRPDRMLPVGLRRNSSRPCSKEKR